MRNARAFENMHTVYGVAAQKLILNVSKIRLRLIFARALHLLLIFAKAPFPIVIFSVWFSFYGGLLHFVYYYFTETKCSTALFACIFLPLLLCSGGVFPLPLQKPQMLFDRPRMDVVLCSNEFDIWSNSLSSIVQGRTMLDSGYRFNRCP